VSDTTPTILDRIARFRAASLEAPGTWPAKRRLAGAVRELLDCICATDADESELLRTAAQLEQTARRFATQPPLKDRPGVAEMALASMETFHDRSPLVGLSNPLAPPLDLVPDAEGRCVRGTGSFGSAYEGAPGCVHGGFVAAAFDELLGAACIFSGNPGMTGELTIRYRNPTPVKTALRFEGRLERVEGRKIYTSGEIYAGEVRTAESTGLFISITREKFERLNRERIEREGQA
jgi:acyl-coenzyme A thioesterase PaaI-like protein